MHDFVVLLETRETATRKRYTETALPDDYLMYSSGISARKGGIGIFVKRTFLDAFKNVDWTILVVGRLARLTLTGPNGKLCIYAVYLDPSSAENQVQAIHELERSLDPHAHNLIAGDFNFVEFHTDRLAKLTANTSLIEDRKQTEAWKRLAAQCTLQEFEQPHFTCEHSHGWSRIDRVYTDLHKANLLCHDTFCTLLTYPRHLSDHSPVSFGMKDKPRRSKDSIPSWVATDTSFEDEVRLQMDYLSECHRKTTGTEPSSLQQLEMLKQGIQSAAKYTRKKAHKALAQTSSHRLACTLSFIKAVEAGNEQQASRMQKRYNRLHRDLGTFSRTSQWYKEVKEHAVELMHIDVSDRVRELKQTRASLASEVYERKKATISRQLKRLLPAGASNDISIIKDEAGSYFSDPANIARILTEHWQATFDSKPTNSTLRNGWLERVRNRFKIRLTELRPTSEDVEKVFLGLHDSAAGPDGIPTGVYMQLKEVAPDIFLQLVRDLIDGNISLDDDFNQAILCCIPKGSNDHDDNGVPIHTAAGTRPLSIVDAANRIVAAILNCALERCVGNRISAMQRGFVSGRQMLMNIIDVDTAAQTISIRSTRGAILLFDFRAAFPSMDHAFIWDTLKFSGIPSQFISAIQSLYRNNRHHIRVNGQLYEGPTVRSGVRQGCPLSGLLFAICVDVLLLRLQDVLTSGNEIARAFADDTATVINDYTRTIPTIATIFQEFEQISGLQLNIDKTVFIPLWPMACERHLKNLITELCPSWRNIKVADMGKYLGFWIGPGAGDSSWEKAGKKFESRIKQWRGTKCGLFWNSLYYNIFTVPTLEFVAQLERVPTFIAEAEAKALRSLAAGPGNWISSSDLEHLGSFGIGTGFKQISVTAKAAKLRLLQTIGKNYIVRKHEQILSAQSDHGRRPFKGWHNASYAKILYDNERELRGLGIHGDSILAVAQDASPNSFQRQARKLVVRHFTPHSIEERVRHKMKRWRFYDPPRHVAERIVNNFNLLAKSVPPAVIASYLRALWNGVPTTRRMGTMAGFRCTNCVFNCSATACDSLEHYFYCHKLFDALRACPITRFPDAVHRLDTLFGVVKGMSAHEKVEAARIIHVMLRLIHFARRTDPSQDFGFAAVLEWRKTLA